MILAPTRWWKRGQHAIANPIHDIFGNPAVGIRPFGGGLPKKLAVGESFSLYFPHNENSFARDKLRAVGLRDNFDRYHRAPNKQVRKVKAELDRAFGQAPAGG